MPGCRDSLVHEAAEGLAAGAQRLPVGLGRGGDDELLRLAWQQAEGKGRPAGGTGAGFRVPSVEWAGLSAWLSASGSWKGQGGWQRGAHSQLRAAAWRGRLPALVPFLLPCLDALLLRCIL